MPHSAVTVLPFDTAPTRKMSHISARASSRLPTRCDGGKSPCHQRAHARHDERLVLPPSPIGDLGARPFMVKRLRASPRLSATAFCVAPISEAVGGCTGRRPALTHGQAQAALLVVVERIVESLERRAHSHD